MKSVDTQICLPPGLLSGQTVREILHLAFDDFRWFTPARYGMAFLDQIVLPGEVGRNDVMGFYRERRGVIVAALTDRDFISIFPDKGSPYPYIGKIHWYTVATSARKAEWREAHARQVKQLMLLLKSPIASAALDMDFEAKTRRWVPREIGSEQIITVRDYSEGLAGLYWRNFFGPPFVELFGDRLNALPQDCVRDLGDGIVLVEPYALPSDAETDAGRAREQELIAQLGSDCFYDHVHHVMPARRPKVPPPPG